MTKDFANSLEQLLWKHATESYKRATRVIEMTKNKPEFSSHMDYWSVRKEELEQKYPILKQTI